MSSFTASGARRTGDEYQDLQSAEVLIEWLEQPDRFRWVRLETMNGSLDDIQGEFSDASRLLLQVKFGTNPALEWEWDDLLEQENGKRGPKPSLLQKWKTSLDAVVNAGTMVREAALVTNRNASASIRSHLSDSGLLEFTALSPSLQASIAKQLGSHADAVLFFSSFHFRFKEPSVETFESFLWERFRRIGGTESGWASLLRSIRRWINRRNEPSSDGTITLADVRKASLWHLPPMIPQGFLVPEDYVAPEIWSRHNLWERLLTGEDQVFIVTGRPGIGKSTYLSWLVEQLKEAEVPVIRHHYFLSMTDDTVARTDWETAATDLIVQLRSSYPSLVRAVNEKNPLPNTLRSYLTAAGQERTKTNPLVVIVDGLDHVWRDTGSEGNLRLLFDRLLPAPDGVVFIVGTQDVDIANIPLKLRVACPRERWLELPVLDGDGVYKWLVHHRDELKLPSDEDFALRLFGQLSESFHAISGGHPLVLHYTFNVVTQRQLLILPENVRELPAFDSSSNVATYYQLLWDSVGSEGHQLLHLLAAFPWVWPQDGLVQCLAPQANVSLLESAKRTVRHVLGTSSAGVTAFHESLLAFIRAIPEHEITAQTLRPLVIDWLQNHAPEFWRWRYEWEECAKSGDNEPLISSATLEWCIDSFVEGRGRHDVAKIVAESGRTALSAARLGVATERQLMHYYVQEGAGDQQVLSSLTWLALLGRNPRERYTELNLFVSRKERATIEEIESVAEIAFLSGYDDISEVLLAECGERWNACLRRSDRMDDTVRSLERSMPLLIAGSLAFPSEGPYQLYINKYGNEPQWCVGKRYVKALARLCAKGDETEAIRAELRYIANQSSGSSLEAVDEIVRLACREGFDARGWIETLDARSSGFFRCYCYWMRMDTEIPASTPTDVSFQSISRDLMLQDEDVFVELTRSFFLLCLAAALEERKLPHATGLSVQASKIKSFLSILSSVAVDAAAVLMNPNRGLDAAWFINRVINLDYPEVNANDYNNYWIRPSAIAKIVVTIAQDLEELHMARTNQPSLTQEVITAAIKSKWTWGSVWIEVCVERRTTMSDANAARILMNGEQARLRTSHDYLHTRAEQYSTLAQFSFLHGAPMDDVKLYARLAARNLLGHGFHKDMILFDVLGAIRASGRSDQECISKWLKAVSPVIQLVGEITDGDETRHLIREFGTVVRETMPQSLPYYLRALQRNHHHWQVETCITDLAKSLTLVTPYEKALAGTMVHEEALLELQRRAHEGDTEAATVLDGVFSYCGRRIPVMGENNKESNYQVKDDDKLVPSIESYPPERLAEFRQAVREAGLYGDTYLYSWTTYWSSREPDKLLNALTSYRKTHGYPLEMKSANEIVDLVFERQGRKAAWDWLISYHKGLYGWSSYMYGLNDVAWIWERVRTRFKDLWLKFILRSSNSNDTPTWGIERMVRYLMIIGHDHEIDEVLDAAVGWAAGLAADMLIPDAALTVEQPDLPLALVLLVDRLDSPSRLVQERAAWSIARLIANPDTRDSTISVLLHWHRIERLEMRSCVFLLILSLARIAHGLPADICEKYAIEANLMASIGTDLMLREYGKVILDSLNHQRHSGQPCADFSRPRDFPQIVSAHLAPIFNKWARSIDKLGIPFSEQWEWEADTLTKQRSLSLRLNAHFVHHYQGGLDEGSLPINDRLSVILRSAFLRALNWAIDCAGIDIERAAYFARRVAYMTDPVVWSVGQSPKPDRWPLPPNDWDDIGTVREHVGRALDKYLGPSDDGEGEVLLYSAGPVGTDEKFSAQLVIRSFLQSAHGALRPSRSELASLPELICHPVPPRSSLPGTYMCFGDASHFIGHWYMAPLTWRMEPDTHGWLSPDRQVRGVYLPATWIVSGSPVVIAEPNQLAIKLGDELIGRYRYWNDELRERQFLAAGSRAGSELLVRRKWLESHLSEGATLCWVATLLLARRNRYERRYDQPEVMSTWIFGGSSVVRPRPWDIPDVQ